jgi:hypothetical protein
MTLSEMALAVPGIVAVGVLARCARDLAVLRRLDRLLEGCDQEQRDKVCRILAASLQSTEGAERSYEPPSPGEPTER